jgi:ribonuclease HI
MKVVVYTDGACSNNGKRGAKASYAYYLPEHQSLSDAGAIPDDQPQTNNRGELSAILHGVNKVLASFPASDVDLYVYTDSDYSKNCLTKWVSGWIKKGWKTSAGTPVINRDLIEDISGKLVVFKSYCITWVKAHTGGTDEHSKNNEIVDRLATEVLEGPKEKVVIVKTEGCPLQLMGPPIEEKELAKWCLANLDKICYLPTAKRVRKTEPKSLRRSYTEPHGIALSHLHISSQK